MNPEYDEVFDKEFQCIRINGILCPDPEKIIYCPMQPPSSSAEQNARNPEDGAPIPESSRKKRDLSASTVTKSKEISLKLFRCQRTSKYILQIQEVETSSNISWYITEPSETQSGKRRVKVRETKGREWELIPVTEEVFPNDGGKYGLSLEKRLEGKWRIETRKRNNLAKTDFFYFHEKVNKTMRSLAEVATFVICNTIY